MRETVGTSCMYVDIRCRIYRQKKKKRREMEDRVEGTERVENCETEERERGKSAREGREENHETIGGAEAAAFHVAWHRLPLKSLLLFVSSSKIMIVCPRDLLLGGSLGAPLWYVYVVCSRVCARRPPRGHRDLSLGRERVPGSGGDGGGLPRLKNRGFTALATKLELGVEPFSLSFCFSSLLVNVLVALSRLGFAKLASVWIKRFRFESKKLPLKQRKPRIKRRYIKRRYSLHD